MVKILIVDGEFLARKLLKIYLTALGEIDIAINGTEAVSAILNKGKDNLKTVNI